MTTKPKGLKVWVKSHRKEQKFCLYWYKSYIDCPSMCVEEICLYEGRKLFGPMKDGEIKWFEITAKEVKRG